MEKINIMSQRRVHVAVVRISSVAKLVSRPAKFVVPGIIDYKEASPISLIKERTESFYTKKLTEITKRRSHINASLNR